MVSHDSPSPKAAPPGGKAGRLGVCLVLAVLVGAAFGPAVHCDFVNFDDDRYVYENPEVSRGLSLSGVLWAFTRIHSTNWHPLTWLSHMLDCQIHGLAPGGHHLTNVLLQAVAAVLLFLVLESLTGAFWRSAFIAALFAVHPLRVESVAWISERKDLLSGIFFLLTIWAYAGYARRPGSAARYGLVALLFALGLMCKPMLVTLPAVLLILDYWPLHRAATTALRRLILEKLPLLGLAALSSATTIIAQQEALSSFEQVPVGFRLVNATLSLVVYLKQLVFPVDLAVFYPRFLAPGWPLKMLLALALLALISLAAFALRRRFPYLLAGWLWYLVMLAPVIGLIQVGAQAHADRYTYLPQIGLLIALTWLAADLAPSRSWGKALAAGAACLLAVFIALSRSQTAHWRNSETLWTHALACTSNNNVAHNNLGNVFLRRKETDRAISHYQKALALAPLYPEANHNLGLALLSKDRISEAIPYFQSALKVFPRYEAAHENLGLAYYQTQHWDQAITAWQAVVEINPRNARVQANLGTALFQRGRVPEAAAHWQQAIAMAPPGSLTVLGNLAWLLATSPDDAIRNGPRAVELAETADRIADGKNRRITTVLAAAYAEAGRFEDASHTLQKAITQAGAEGQRDAKMEKQLEFYQAGQPWREAAAP